MKQARQDGSYDSYLVPDEVRELDAAGEKFYPRELAALVHNESSILSKKATNEAIKRGDNVIIDGTLGNEKQARMLLDKLAAAGYDVKVADVATTQAGSEARTMGRWERGYLDAENGAAEGPDAKLGGRWVPQSFPASLFITPEDKESKCAANAAAVSARLRSEYVVYRVADQHSGPVLESRQGRTKPNGPLVDGGTLAAVRTAATARPGPAVHQQRPRTIGYAGQRRRPGAEEPGRNRSEPTTHGETLSAVRSAPTTRTTCHNTRTRASKDFGK